jgi:hypothetical protein
VDALKPTKAERIIACSLVIAELPADSTCRFEAARRGGTTARGLASVVGAIRAGLYSRIGEILLDEGDGRSLALMDRKQVAGTAEECVAGIALVLRLLPLSTHVMRFGAFRRDGTRPAGIVAAVDEIRTGLYALVGSMEAVQRKSA